MLLQLLLLVSSQELIDAYEISSDRITNWGSWGSWDECPAGSFVKAINLKVERDLGRGDDTALNAVRLTCVDLNQQMKNNRFSTNKQLKSSEGKWGHFKGVEYCRGGVAIGFQLKSEDNQGMWDDSAANDMRLICANKHGTYPTIDKGQRWGTWRPKKICPQQTAVCGLRTQVEGEQNKGDDTALNNVDLLCCDLPNPAELCRPTDEWVVFFRRDNSKGTTPIKFTLTEKIGVHKEHATSKSSLVIEEIAEHVGFGGGITAGSLLALGLNFERKLSTSQKTEHTWTRRELSVFKQEKEETTELVIPPGCDTTYYQLVGYCGSYVVNSNAMRRIDKYANGTNTTYTS